MALTLSVEQPRKKGSLSRLLVNQFLGGGCGGSEVRAPLGEEQLKALVEATGLDPSEVEGKYTKFLEQHPEGNIDKKEFKRMVSSSHNKRTKNFKKNKVFVSSNTESKKKVAIFSPVRLKN